MPCKYPAQAILSLNGNTNDRHSTQKTADDVVITLAIRTPLTKGKKGGFKDTHLDGIVVKLLKEVVKRGNIDPALVEDICLGNVRRKPPTLTTRNHTNSPRSPTQKLRIMSAPLPSPPASQTPPPLTPATASAPRVSRPHKISLTPLAWVASLAVLPSVPSP
jgi:hypothetical protein